MDEYEKHRIKAPKLLLPYLIYFFIPLASFITLAFYEMAVENGFVTRANYRAAGFHTFEYFSSPIILFGFH
jgi:hypothetical protein